MTPHPERQPLAQQGQHRYEGVPVGTDGPCVMVSSNVTVPWGPAMYLQMAD